MKTTTTLQAGEQPIANAPPVRLGNGELCIPQHYLLFAHTRESVEALILDIEFDDSYLIFVCEDNSGIYIQIGIVGFDNFIDIKKQQGKKVVYGRKWRVEPQLPTSEIIQTVFFALKTAREHEIRELFQLECERRITTPFNNHHDLPLMALNSELVITSSQESELSNAELLVSSKWQKDEDNIQLFLNAITFDSSKLILKILTRISDQCYLIDITVERGRYSQLPEMVNAKISLIVTRLSANELYYELMEKLICLSNRYVEEHFCYRDYPRFSRKNCIESIAKLSSTLRNISKEVEQNKFFEAFDKANYDTDTTRVPALHEGDLSVRLKQKMKGFGDLSGILPT